MYESVHKYKFTLKSCACSVSMKSFSQVKQQGNSLSFISLLLSRISHLRSLILQQLHFSFFILKSTRLKNDTKISIVLQEIMNS